MLNLSAISFNFSEGLALAGLAQGISVVLYLVLRVRQWRQSIAALAYFVTLCLCFTLQFALRLEDMWSYLRLLLWLGWTTVPVVSYLLILQISTVRHVGSETFMPRPKPAEWLLLFMPGVILAVAHFAPYELRECRAWFSACADYMEIVNWLGSMLGAATLGVLWLQRDLFTGLRQGAGGRERYWLVLTLIVTNIGIVVTMLWRAWGSIGQLESDALFVIMGLAALYLASSSLFRVYPTVIDLAPEPRALRVSAEPTALNAEEEVLLARVRELIDVQKVYHEQSFGRGALARELACSESQLSRVVNYGYGKSLPRLLNERRVADAQRMLADPTIPVQVIAFEVGFNSLASFNRVFKEITGQTPSSFRQEPEST
ncbi:MAG: hypothetical protein C0509_06825 [Acinetobacter sp.]|nr:hypothetical protein [Acinetobacter sp.]